MKRIQEGIQLGNTGGNNKTAIVKDNNMRIHSQSFSNPFVNYKLLNDFKKCDLEGLITVILNNNNF